MKTTIQINGKLYDAISGKVVSKTTQSTNRPDNSPIIAKQPNGGISMDGISIKKNAYSAPSQRLVKPAKAQPSQPVINISAQDIKRPKPTTPIKQNQHHSGIHAQRSQTLKRNLVKKPLPESRPEPHAKSATPNTTIHSRVEHSATGRGMLIKKIPETRLARAMSAPRSTLVTKFGRSASKKPRLSTDLKVVKEPTSTPSSIKKANANLDKPIEKVNSKIQSIKPSVFEDQLLKANSHQQKPVKKQSRVGRMSSMFRISTKAASFTAAVFAVLILGGFFAYQELPAVGIKVAANRAGFDARLPNSIPAGYAFQGPIHSEPNNVALTYVSRTDDRSFIMTQRPTNWSSEALLNNYLIDSQFRYQIYRDKGLTVYVYNGSNATWVDKGVWYSVTSKDQSLSSEQLLEIASSI